MYVLYEMWIEPLPTATMTMRLYLLKIPLRGPRNPKTITTCLKRVRAA